MLRDGDIQVWIGRASHGGDFMRLVHVPTGITREHPGPMKGINRSDLERQWVREIEEELARDGLSQYIVPPYRTKTNLKFLELDKTAIDDSGVEHLCALADLQQLSLDNTAISDAGLHRIGTLENLEDLSLRWTRITDAGLAELTALTSLKFLDLRGTRVTDSGLQHLKSLKCLQQLNLVETEVTKAACEQLSREMSPLWISK